MPPKSRQSGDLPADPPPGPPAAKKAAKKAPAKKVAPAKTATKKAATKKAAAAPTPPPPPPPAAEPALAPPSVGWAALATPEPRPRNVPAIVALGAAGVVVVGSLMPWATAKTVFGDISINGTDGDGVLTLILALVVGAIAVALLVGKRPRLWAYVVLLIAALLTAFIAVYDLVDISRAVGNEYAHVSTGAGVWLVAIASLVLVAGGVQLTRARSRVV